jgi:hypothetical protein
VRIVWRDGKGRRRVTNVGLPEPASAVVAIDKARAMLPAAPSPDALPAGDDD